jgi:hypothetical protein
MAHMLSTLGVGNMQIMRWISVFQDEIRGLADRKVDVFVF